MAHFRILVGVRLATPRKRSASELSPATVYFRSLGVNASTVSAAVRYVEEFIQRKDAKKHPGSVSEIEAKELAIHELPHDVERHAFADLTEEGVYWCSGKAFAAHDDEE